MNSSAKITLSMIVKDEEKYLRECLESVKDIIDEIIVVDTGSSDNTLKIAEEFGAKTFQFKWINDFSAARNFALGKSSGDWILYLDADERLSGKSIKRLKDETSKNDLTGCRCIVNNLDDFNGRQNYMRYTRLFHNSQSIKFTGAVHEQIDDSLIANGYDIIDTDIEIIHIGYNATNREIKKKAERNLMLLKGEYEKKSSAYNSFQMANTYSLLKDYKAAYKYFLISVGADNLNPEYKAHSYLFLSDYEFKKHNVSVAVKFLNKGLQNDSSNTLLNLLACDISFRINKRNKALEYCKKAFNENAKVMSANNKPAFAIRLKPELIISKGIYYSLLSSDDSNLDYFLSELDKENSKHAFIIEKFIKNRSISSTERDEILKTISTDNLDLFLFIIENYSDKKTALEILLSFKDLFNKNSKYLKTLGLLYFENKLYNESIKKYEESLLQKEKDPASVFYLISAFIESNQTEKIPDLLLFAESEFGNIPEFNSAFENLKQKLNKFFNPQTLQEH